MLSWSDQLHAIAGLDPDRHTLTIASFVALVHQADRDRVATLISEAMQNHSRLNYECQLLRPEGTVRVLHGPGRLRGRRDRGPGQDVRHLLGHHRA